MLWRNDLSWPFGVDPSEPASACGGRPGGNNGDPRRTGGRERSLVVAADRVFSVGEPVEGPEQKGVDRRMGLDPSRAVRPNYRVVVFAASRSGSRLGLDDVGAYGRPYTGSAGKAG